MTDPAVNEAAERLHDLAAASEFEWDESEWDRTLHEALATERRNTVERIRTLIPDRITIRFNEEQLTLDDLSAILDEVAS